MELKITDLTKVFGKTKAVNQVNYTFQSGVYGLLGVNGAGKTTLCGCSPRLDQPAHNNGVC